MQNLKGFGTPGTTHKLSPSGAELTQALSANVQKFRIAATADMHVTVDGTTADNTQMLLLAEQAEYFSCAPGATVRVFGTGDCYITEMM